MRGWYLQPVGVDGPAWRKAVREVAELLGDVEALDWIRGQELFFELLERAGLLVGCDKPPPTEREKVYAELDAFLGV